VDFPERSGISAIHWFSIGETDTPDVEIMAHALHSGYVVLTQDLDFGTILSITGAATPSVIQIRPELEAGALVTIERKRTRLTMLPIRRLP
jgi:predicted nuclease of predicted toxin-antitoxin system